MKALAIIKHHKKPTFLRYVDIEGELYRIKEAIVIIHETIKKIDNSKGKFTATEFYTGAQISGGDTKEAALSAATVKINKANNYKAILEKNIKKYGIAKEKNDEETSKQK